MTRKVICDDKRCFWNNGEECRKKQITLKCYGDLPQKTCLDKEFRKDDSWKK